MDEVRRAGHRDQRLPARALRRRARRTVEAYLFLSPAVVFMGLFVVVPVFLSLLYGLTKYDIISSPKFIGLQNFVRLFHDPLFLVALKNSILYSLVVVPSLTVLTLLVATVMNNRVPLIQGFRLAFYIPVVTSIVVVGLLWKLLFESAGFFNLLLIHLRLIRNPIPFLTSPSATLYWIMLVTVWHASGYYMILYLTGLQSIPNDLYAAAMLDGTNYLQKLWHITVPSLRPTVAMVIVISFIGSVQVFGEVYTMTGGGPGDSTETLVFYIYQSAFQNLNVGYGAAMSIVLFVLLSVAMVYIVRQGDRGVRF